MEITASLIKELRDKTGAGMMECKSVLTESQGNLEQAEELLKKRGLARASKLATRETKQGLIDTYVHGGRIGAMIEVNCETDFVSRNEGFRELTHELAMQIAAANPQFVDRDSIPAEMLEQMRSEFTAQAAAEGKPERVREQIVQGRLDKYFQEVCLLEQPWVKEPERPVGDLVKQFSAKTGENVRVNRFARFVLGE
jgi:elongation factor Ts